MIIDSKVVAIVQSELVRRRHRSRNRDATLIIYNEDAQPSSRQQIFLHDWTNMAFQRRAGLTVVRWPKRSCCLSVSTRHRCRRLTEVTRSAGLGVEPHD